MAEDTTAVDRANATGRRQLAAWVVLGSFLTIFLLVGAMLGIAKLGGTDTKASDLAEKTFNAILPVLASWVGTVLAFYFSAQSQERTSNSLDKAINAGAPTDGKIASAVMVPLGQIKQLIDLDQASPADLTTDGLTKIFGGAALTGVLQGNKGPVTRLIFVNTSVFRYVLHKATLDAFLVSQRDRSGDVPFETFRSDPTVLNQISRLVVFVSATSTLKDAKTALDRVPGAQDIIVTATGNSSEPMLGWISNVDLIKALTGG